MTSEAASALITAGTASLVEFVEACTVVLAVGASRGWRSAFAGVGAGLLFLALLVSVFGPALRLLPLAPMQLVLGTLLVLFGNRWLRKATRRAAGVIPLRDEAVAFRRQHDRVCALSRPVAHWDRPALTISFQATMVEGVEVVFIVVAIGAGGHGLLGAAALGAVLALALVAVLAALLHRPITRVPENTLKRLVGAMLSGFGTFWVGEGAGLVWPGGDAWIVPLTLGYLLVSLAVAARLRRVAPAPFS